MPPSGDPLAAASLPATKPKSQGSTFLLLLGVFVVLFLMFDPALRTAMATYMGFVLDPVFAPLPIIWTLFVVGSIMVLANTVVRHFFTDWVQMARVQEVMRAFQKEFSEARKANNTYKMKRLGDMNPEIMKMQADLSSQQMKPMILTMLVVLPIFGWLFHVVDPMTSFDSAAEVCTNALAVGTQFTDEAGKLHRGCCDTFLNVPWAAEGTWCADEGTDWVGFIPRWIAIYSLLSIPIGQVVQRGLKFYEYRRVDLDADGIPMGKSR